MVNKKINPIVNLVIELIIISKVESDISVRRLKRFGI